MTMTTLRTPSLLTAAVLLCALSFGAPCQDFPSKPVRVIVPYAAGGGADILARLMGQELTARLKQPVVVENRGGASNTIGMQVVASSPKDGYTLGLATPVFVMTPSLIRNHPYDPPKHFAPVGMIGNTPMRLVLHPSVPAKTTREFIALA